MQGLRAVCEEWVWICCFYLWVIFRQMQIPYWGSVQRRIFMEPRRKKRKEKRKRKSYDHMKCVVFLAPAKWDHYRYSCIEYVQSYRETFGNWQIDRSGAEKWNSYCFRWWWWTLYINKRHGGDIGWKRRKEIFIVGILSGRIWDSIREVIYYPEDIRAWSWEQIKANEACTR